METLRCWHVTRAWRVRVYAACMMATTVGQQQLVAARAAFAEGDVQSLAMLPLPLQQSWQRSHAAGVRPGQEPYYPPLQGNGHHLASRDDRRLARCVQPELEQLWSAFGARGWTMFCANREGMVIVHRAHGLEDAALLRPIQVGRRLGEAEIGTTAPAVSLADDLPALVRGNEHYLQRFAPVFCLSEPLHDLQGQVCGAIDITVSQAELATMVGVSRQTLCMLLRRLEDRGVVEVYLNDRGPYRFAVDTAASASVIASDLIEPLDLRPGGFADECGQFRRRVLVLARHHAVEIAVALLAAALIGEGVELERDMAGPDDVGDLVDHAFGAPALVLAQTEAPAGLKPSAALLETLPEAAQGSVPSFVSGDRLHGKTDGVVVIEGGAELRRHGTVIKADRLEYDQKSSEAKAEGHVLINRSGNRFEGPALQLNVDTSRGHFEQPAFSLLQSDGHGDLVGQMERIGEQQDRDGIKEEHGSPRVPSVGHARGCALTCRHAGRAGEDPLVHA